MIYKFYIIKSDLGNKVYIGSTTRTLRERLVNHRTDHCSAKILFDEYGFENCIIELIKEINFETKEEARKEEGKLILEAGNNTVNKRIDGRDKKKYYQIYKKEIKEYQKKYRENNKDKLKEKRKEKNKRYREDNKEKIKERNKRYMENNKEKMKEYQKKYYKSKKDSIINEFKGIE